MRGMIHPRGDEDLFRLPPAPSGTQGVAITVKAIPKVTLSVALVDDARNVLKAAEGSGSRDRVVRTLVDPGKSYFLLIRDERGKESNPRDSYEVHVAFE